MARIKKIEVVPGTKLQVAKVGKFQGYKECSMNERNVLGTTSWRGCVRNGH